MKLAGKKIHFMGIGGIGMSALAGIAINQGALVSGCDRAENEQTAALRGLGAEIVIGHDVSHVAEIDLLVFTSAVSLEHPEIAAAGEKAIRRGSFLAKVIGEFKSIGVCGTHGKTSTTWMIAHILIELGLDPTVLLGGVTESMGGNYRCGGELFVSELDESDGSFLDPEINVGIITNIESEHLAYYHTSEKVVEAFKKFADNITASDLLILGTENKFCQEIYSAHTGRKVAFGINNCRVGLYVEKHWIERGHQYAELFFDNKRVGALDLPLSGRHNILNALAAILAVREVGVSFSAALNALSTIKTVQRRMEQVAEINGSKIYSDYAHHPTEVQAALSGARELDEGGNILAIFQPHLYSRTRDYADEFARTLLEADKVIVVEVYPAREEPIAGVNSSLLIEKLRHLGADVTGSECKVEDIVAAIKSNAGCYSTIVCIGAGNIDVEVRKIV